MSGASVSPPDGFISYLNWVGWAEICIVVIELGVRARIFQRLSGSPALVDGGVQVVDAAVGSWEL